MTTIAPPERRPCIGHVDLYDIALHSSRRAPREPVRQARIEAAALCATCPLPCDEPVTPRGRKPGPAATSGLVCTVGECQESPHALGLCMRHYAAQHRTGSPTGVRRQVDPAVVKQVVAGQDPGRRLTRAEREQVVTQLHGQGLYDQAIADRLHTTKPVICRLRAALGLPVHPRPVRAREIDRLRALERAALDLIAELPDSPAATRLRNALAV